MKPSSSRRDEPYAGEGRMDLWELRGSNPPGRPGPGPALMASPIRCSPRSAGGREVPRFSAQRRRAVESLNSLLSNGLH